MTDFETEFFGEKELRWYQVATRNRLIESLNAGKRRICIVQPTGCGKTITIASSLTHEDVRRALGVSCDRKLRVLFSAHKHRLLTQAEETFAELFNVEIIPHSIFSDLPMKEFEKGIDVVVSDEFHHESCASFQYHLQILGDYPIIGLTATPDRADGMVIKFQEIIEPISREDAVDQGYLAQTFLNTVVDSSAKNKVEVTKSILDTYLHEFGQTIMFFRTRAEVREITRYLKSRGVSAVPLLSQNPDDIETALNRFSDGEVQFLVNCSIISEGVDLRGCTTIYLGRAVNSYPLLNQIIGRAARPDSDCNVFELVNPLSGTNLDSTVVTGTPERHRLISHRGGKWTEREFDYTSHRNVIEMSDEKTGYF